MTYTFAGVLRLKNRLGKVRMVGANRDCIGMMLGRSAALALASALLLSVSSLATAPAAEAQTNKAQKQAKQVKDAKAAADAQRENAAAGQRAYSAGVKSFETGDLAAAEQQLSVALSGGGLPNSQMARALYYRGSAYRQLGRPAQAISDLTTAVWLKGGLPDDLKAKAVEARKLAYQEAGLGVSPPPVGAAPLDQAKAGASPGAPTPATGTQVVTVQPQGFWSGVSMPSMSMPSLSLPSLTGSSTAEPQVTAAVAAEPAPPAASSQPASSSFWGFLPSLTGSSGQSAESGGFQTTTVAETGSANAPAMGFAAVPDAAAHSGQGSSWSTETAAAAAAQPVSAQNVVASYVPPPDATGATPVSTPPPAASSSEASPGGSTWNNPLAGTGAAVGGFFSNMFGSSGSTPAPQADGSAGAGWGPDSTVVTSQTSSMVQRGPDAPPSSGSEPMPWSAQNVTTSAAPVRVAAAAPSGGRYKLQVAAVRSRDEAERLAQSLSDYQGVRDGAVKAEIDEAVIGSMGTFYRVRLGPYADAKEPGQLCQSLKPQGFDCLVVTQ